MELLLPGVVGREGVRPICNGRVGIDGVGAEIGPDIVGVPLVNDGERPRRVGNGGARDIADNDGRP